MLTISLAVKILKLACNWMASLRHDVGQTIFRKCEHLIRRLLVAQVSNMPRVWVKQVSIIPRVLDCTGF